MDKNIQPWPRDWPKYYNGTNEPCDMRAGPCSCGAWHDLGEFEMRDDGLYRVTPMGEEQVTDFIDLSQLPNKSGNRYKEYERLTRLSEIEATLSDSERQRRQEAHKKLNEAFIANMTNELAQAINDEIDQEVKQKTLDQEIDNIGWT